jgi:hypothetical protein
MTPDIASFWTGSPLSFFEQLCLKSFAALGHRTILYSYQSDLNLPDGVELRDAGTIMPNPEALLSKVGFAAFADIFRLNMIHQTGAVWVDCDVVAVKPMPDLPYVVARAGRWVGNAVLRLPPESKALKLLLDMFNCDELVLPEDFPQRHLLPEPVRARTPAGMPFHIRDDERRQLPYMAHGPVALSYALGKTGEIQSLLEKNLFYPYQPYSLRANYFRARRALPELPAETVAIHHIGGKPFRMGFQMKGRFMPPHPASLIGRLCTQHGIDPMAAPVILKPAAGNGEVDATMAEDDAQPDGA